MIAKSAVCPTASQMVLKQLIGVAQLINGGTDAIRAEFGPSVRRTVAWSAEQRNAKFRLQILQAARDG